MLYNKLNIEVAKFASKGPHLILTGVLFDKNKTVAATGPCLLEVSTRKYQEQDAEIPPVLLNAEYILKHLKFGPKDREVQLKSVEELPNGIKKADFYMGKNEYPISVPSIDSENKPFPDYKKFIPKDKPKAEFDIDGELFAKLLHTMGKLGTCSRVKVKIYSGATDPIILEAKNSEQSARGMIMPLREE